MLGNGHIWRRVEGYHYYNEHESLTKYDLVMKETGSYQAYVSVF